MKRVVMAIISLSLLCGCALCEENALEKIDITPIIEWADKSNGIDAREIILKLIKGEYKTDFDGLFARLKDIALEELSKSLRYMALLCAPCFILAALRVIYPDGNVVGVLELVCSLALTATLVSIFSFCVSVTGDFLASIGAFNESVYPVIADILALSGKASASALFTPTAALFGSVVSSGIAAYSPIFAVCAATLAAAGQLSSGIKLDGLERLVKRSHNIGLCAAMTALICLMAARGELAKGYDSSSIQTAKFTIGSLLPIVGGEVADSMDALVLSASLIKNAVGVTGLILLAGVCAKPLIILALYSLIVRLSSAMVEPLGGNAAQKACERFADAMEMLLAACAASCVLMMILIGAAMTLFGGQSI